MRKINVRIRVHVYSSASSAFTFTQEHHNSLRKWKTSLWLSLNLFSRHTQKNLCYYTESMELGLVLKGVWLPIRITLPWRVALIICTMIHIHTCILSCSKYFTVKTGKRQFFFKKYTLKGDDLDLLTHLPK